MKNEKRMDNNGFSLVELIIVIAIMAVLIGVLAPQYIRYVERGRVSADGATMDSYISAMQVLAADTEVTLSTSASYTVTSAANSDAITVSSALQTLLEDLEADAAHTLQSTTYRDADISLELTWQTDHWAVTGLDTLP